MIFVGRQVETVFLYSFLFFFLFLRRQKYGSSYFRVCLRFVGKRQDPNGNVIPFWVTDTERDKDNPLIPHPPPRSLSRWKIRGDFDNYRASCPTISNYSSFWGDEVQPIRSSPFLFGISESWNSFFFRKETNKKERKRKRKRRKERVDTRKNQNT